MFLQKSGSVRDTELQLSKNRLRRDSYEYLQKVTYTSLISVCAQTRACVIHLFIQLLLLWNLQITSAPIGSLQNPAQSCQHLLNLDKHAPSGEYWIQPQGSNKMQVYCEMDVGGGGFTFVSTRAVTASATSSSISQLMTKRSSVLFRFVTDKFEQYYSIVEQLDKFRYKPLFVSQNSDVGYTQPVNKRTMGATGYLFVGILDAATARVKGAVQGYKSNGVPIDFTNCDANPNSYIALFPNHDELSPSSYHVPLGFFNRWRNTFKPIPAGLEMPRKYFFFTEMHFGGCGVYSSSNNWGFLTASAVGVR